MPGERGGVGGGLQGDETTAMLGTGDVAPTLRTPLQHQVADRASAAKAFLTSLPQKDIQGVHNF